MKKRLLISVTYTDSTDKFWQESSIKNMRVTFNPDKDNIHEVIKELCSEQDGMRLSYKGKPQGNIYQDVLDENDNIKGCETVGYMYRGKSEIYDRNMIKSQTGLFDVWVSILEVVPFTIEDVEK